VTPSIVIVSAAHVEKNDRNKGTAPATSLRVII
jgi:hypothetical protein